MTDPRDVPAEETEAVDESLDLLPNEAFKPLIDEEPADDAPDEGDDPDPEDGPNLAELPDEVRDGDVGTSEPEEI